MSKKAEEKANKQFPFVDYPFTPLDLSAYQREAYIEGYQQAEKDLAPLINRLCEAILFDWKDAADLARKTLIQIKEMEEEYE